MDSPFSRLRVLPSLASPQMMTTMWRWRPGGDSELNLVTEVWVEPCQHGRVGPGPESWRHLQDLTYCEIPQAVSGLGGPQRSLVP